MTIERDGGRREVLQAGEAETGSFKVCQFEVSFHFIFKKGGLGPRKGYKSVLQIGITHCNRAIGEFCSALCPRDII